MIKIYSKGALLRQLKENKLPASYKHLLRLEEKKIISLPGTYVLVGIVGRAYSEEEVASIVEQVKADQERKKQKNG